ncbi:MAG: gamma-glutamylcyclotransferase family protein [Rhizobiaceae bacterium]
MTYIEEDTVAYFGYGSLVNLATLRTSYITAWPAKLRGWERVWLPRPKVAGSFAPIDGLAFLSVQPNPAVEIDGIIVIDKAESLESLDTREAAYRRHRIELPDVTVIRPENGEPFDIPMFMYVADTVAPEGQEARILRSYLDAVFQGYLTHFGEEGVRRFVETTANFGLEILEDREEPVYPRAVGISEIERGLFDIQLPIME